MYFLERMLVVIIFALCIQGCGGSSSNESESTVVLLNSPINIQDSIDDKGITLAWSPVEGAESYNIYYSTDSSLNMKNYAVYENSAWIRNVKSPYVLSDLKPANFYYFIITAVKGSNESNGTKVHSVMTRYKIIGKSQDIVQDTMTNLEWQRCSLGQMWNLLTKNCDGVAAKYNFKNIPKIEGWRVPTVDEMLTLVYCAKRNPPFSSKAGQICESEFAVQQQPPLIVDKIFPKTVYPGVYHTSTLVDNPGEGRIGYFSVSFSTGQDGSDTCQLKCYEFVTRPIRLVRSVIKSS